MFEYNFHSKAKQLFVGLPDDINFNFAFLDSMTELIEKASSKACEEICVSCSPKASYDKMSKAYLLNVLRSLLKQKSVKWNVALSKIIEPKIHAREGSRFEEVDFNKVYIDDNLDYYIFNEKKTVAFPVGEMVKILVENNMTLNTEGVKEFLSTTIGEIFSNCFLHSNQDKAFFMFDIVYENTGFYLCVNIIDYGTTLVSNVKRFFSKNYNEEKSSVECFEWATKKGTTTREGSGGYGLYTLIEYISKANGELYIFSGDAYYSLCNGNRFIKNSKGCFYGTSVTFKVKLFETSQFIKYDSSENRLVTISLDCI